MKLPSLKNSTDTPLSKNLTIINGQDAEIARLKKREYELEQEKQSIYNSKEQLFYNLDYIISRMPGFVYWKDLNSTYMGCNENLAKVSNLKNRAEIVGKTDFDFQWGKNEAEQFIKDDQYIIRTKKTLITEYELPVKREDGTYLYVRTEKMPFFDKFNHVIGILAVAMDITDQKILEQKLKEQIDKAEIANKAKTQFIRDMEHDIRTPFCGVYGMADILVRQEKDPKKKSMLKDIYSSARELYDYCNGVLDFSSIETGHSPILEKKFSLKTLLDSVIKIETPAVKIKHLTLKSKYDKKIPTQLLGDEYRVKRILINLISNAVKFTQQGHIQVDITLAKLIDKRNAILKFTVSDTGVGIPADKQNIIYEKFTRLTPANKGLYKGIGLGLAIIKQFVIELDGEISLKSEPGKGSTFTCLLPLKIPLLA